MIPKHATPEGEKVMDAVWAMKRKRNKLPGEVYKWKARLNLHGGQQEFGIHYEETYAPVVSWPTIRMLLLLVLNNGWHSKQIDFVLAYPQAPIERDLYMKLPDGIKTKHGDGNTHVL